MYWRPAHTLPHRAICAVVCLMVIAGNAPGVKPQSGPPQPDYLPIIGQPEKLAVYWHDQRWVAGDAYACALYAQASVMEALGYNFENELTAARALGLRDGWFDPVEGTIGLGQPLRARDIAFEVFGSPLDTTVTRHHALYKLRRVLSVGRYVIVNLDATRLTYYRGSAITWHTLWITGLRLDENGQAITVFANDSYRGPAVEYPIEEFLDAWANEFNYYGIFVMPPKG